MAAVIRSEALAKIRLKKWMSDATGSDAGFVQRFKLFKGSRIRHRKLFELLNDSFGRSYVGKIL